MFEQLTQLVKQYGGDAVVNNAAVPNEHNEAVISETSNSISEGLKKIVSEGRTDEIAGEVDAQYLAAAIGQDDIAHDPTFAQHEQLSDRLVDALDHGPALDLAGIFFQPSQCCFFCVGQGNRLGQSFRETARRHQYTFFLKLLLRWQNAPTSFWLHFGKAH